MPKARKALCLVFAAAAIALPGCADNESAAPAAAPPTPVLPASTDQASAQTIVAFDQKATRVPMSQFAYRYYFREMNLRQHYYMKNPANAQDFQRFLARFDQFRDQPPMEMAKNVNALVKRLVDYRGDGKNYGEGEYWAAPIETAAYRAGDCEDFAFLQYAILRHLGVDEDRLFAVGVNASGKKTGADHEVLLFDLSARKDATRFAVLNVSGPVQLADAYTRPGANRYWPRPYSLYDAINEDGVWKTKLAQRVERGAKSAKPKGPAA